MQIVVPFALGQLVEPKVGSHVRRHKIALRQYDQAVIWLIVFAAMSESMRLHVWTAVKAWQIGLMLAGYCGGVGADLGLHLVPR